MAFSAVYIRMGSVVQHYYQQLVPREKYTPRDMAFLHVYIRMGSTGAATEQLATREKYTPRDMAFLHVYQNGIYTVH
jgi:hypothetical protein